MKPSLANLARIAAHRLLCYNLDGRWLTDLGFVTLDFRFLHPLKIVIPKVLPVSSSSASDEFRKKVYTKFGDAGETSLLYGGRVSKNGLNTEAYGITDEAVSVMGLARAMTSNPRVNDLLRDLQRELFTIAAELATDPNKYELFQQHFKPVTEEMVKSLETAIDSLEEEFEMPKVFILPGGSQASAAIDLARCVIRTAERRVVAMAESDILTNGLIMSYLNRLGDLLFVLARYEDRDIPIERAT
ncbi:MAG: cob(I)yrinic acid a,c-diamide adenosyltransferase [Chloroflexota bacterium]|nr:cob(I)yrinic acid a,c-diamide adenosyltransferase [Chloroflexota bacterium]